jgi:hypothetical protein
MQQSESVTFCLGALLLHRPYRKLDISTLPYLVHTHSSRGLCRRRASVRVSVASTQSQIVNSA